MLRADLAEVAARHEAGLDVSRADSVARQHARGRRTVRENIDDLCDPGTFVEYGALVVAAQSSRFRREELIAGTPADGGGGRPGDDGIGAGFEGMTFRLFGELSGLVPLVGIAGGPCFAGNASLLGCCDVVIATEQSNLGMAGPAMIEGGGLGVVAPEEIGPIDESAANGVVDVRVLDEAEAVRVAKQYLGYFRQGSEEHDAEASWECADQRRLRQAVPENRVQVYDVRAVIETLADIGSVLELRRGFGPGIVTALIRIEGRPLGVFANDPAHLGGAIDSDGADKAARFLQLCDAFDLLILSLPGRARDRGRELLC